MIFTGPGVGMKHQTFIIKSTFYYALCVCFLGGCSLKTESTNSSDELYNIVNYFSEDGNEIFYLDAYEFLKTTSSVYISEDGSGLSRSQRWLLGTDLRFSVSFDLPGLITPETDDYRTDNILEFTSIFFYSAATDEELGYIEIDFREENLKRNFYIGQNEDKSTREDLLDFLIRFL